MQVINEELVDLSIDADSKMNAITLLADRINQAGRLHDHAGYVESVIEREDLTTTGIGFGIAIPHGKSPYVKETTVAFGRLNNKIDWQSLDGEKVGLVFLLAVPEECQGDQHLKIIAGLSRKLIHQEFRSILEQASSDQEIVDLLNDSLAGVVA
ncbi:MULTISPECIES: PTS sugar transporter subunit IIA [Enterococcus]|uniref:PTS sugar transporter subunit IIA n=1 Tax=Candidatus Enterococcus murrayae TaxID=2815321 RepID=A0ABS3HPQ7_9ENTE|nr:fructose PTS transporter subunit IIA [Enterococcus sp. MJM16]MBO0454578.1 PTS sugar transporter subunit IIA [Enterococcus sp. MJM16]